jgi:hypothetical protein
MGKESLAVTLLYSFLVLSNCFSKSNQMSGLSLGQSLCLVNPPTPEQEAVVWMRLSVLPDQHIKRAAYQKAGEIVWRKRLFGDAGYIAAPCSQSAGGKRGMPSGAAPFAPKPRRAEAPQAVQNG